MAERIAVESGVAIRNGQGFVKCAVVIMDAAKEWQWDPAEARQHAAQVMAAADAAESDAAFCRWMREKLNAEDAWIAGALADLRRYREGH